MIFLLFFLLLAATPNVEAALFSQEDATSPSIYR